jgi:beta-lactamase regulating signal transducer with metallopeptidase domain
VYVADATYSLDEVAAHAAASGNGDLAERCKSYAKQRRAERRERHAAIAVTGIGLTVMFAGVSDLAVAALR